MSAPTLLFDLDSTLTDPRPGIVACMRHVVEGLGRRCPDDDALATFIGPPLRGTFATLLETDKRETIEAAMALYRERFGVTGLLESRVYDGIPEMLVEVCSRAALDASLDAKATLVAQLLARECIAPGAAVIIGDRAADVRTAHANGLRAIGVLWGYGSERELREAGADVLCVEPRALAACLG
jgi:phosphoglycolate phosphatase